MADKQAGDMVAVHERNCYTAVGDYRARQIYGKGAKKQCKTSTG